MSKQELVEKNIIKADDYIIILILASYLIFGIIFRLEALVGVAVYPFASLGIFGVLKIVNAFNKKLHGGRIKENMILYGIIYVILSVLLLIYILSQPNITSHVIINLVSYPLMIVGFAGIIKGILIEVYSDNYRIINIIVGLATVIVCLFAFSSVVESVLFNIIIFSVIFFINVLSRAALYLSEYGLSILHITNIKIFFYLISDYLLYIDVDGNIILSKIDFTS